VLVKDLSNEEYHQHEAISSSAVKTVHLKSLLHWKKSIYKESAAFDIGTAVHAFLLEPDKDLVMCGPETRRGKAWSEAKEEADLEGKTLLTKDDYNTCVAMTDSVMRNELAEELLVDECGLNEVSIFSQDPDTGLQLKARPDLFIPERGILLDVKTTRDASPKQGGFERQFFSLGYHVQAAFYKHVLELDGYPIEEFAFLAVEKEYPYAVQMHYLHKDVLSFGLLQVRDTLEQIKDVEGKDVNFTGWPSRNLILLPKWMKATERMDDMTDFTITDVEAQWPKINRPYRFDTTERRSVPCDAFDDGAAYTMDFKMDKTQAKELFMGMAESYKEAREDNWPKSFEPPFGEPDEDGLYKGKVKLKAAFGKEATRKPSQYDAEGNKLPDDFLLTTGSTVNIAVQFIPYHTTASTGVSLRIRAVQVIELAKQMEEKNPFGKVKGYVHNSDNPFKEKAATPEETPPLKVVKSKATKAKAKEESKDVDDDFGNIIDNWN